MDTSDYIAISALIVSLISAGISIRSWRFNVKVKSLELRALLLASLHNALVKAENVLADYAYCKDTVLNAKQIELFKQFTKEGPVVHYRIPREKASIGLQEFISVGDGRPVPWFALLSRAMDFKPRLLVDVPLNGSKQRRLLKVNLPAGAAEVKMPDGPRRIRAVYFELDCHYKIKSDLLTSGAHYEYADSSGTIVQRSEFKTELGGVPIILSMQSGPDSESLPPKCALQLPSSEARDSSPDAPGS